MFRFITIMPLVCSFMIARAGSSSFLNEKDVIPVISKALTGDNQFHYQAFEIDVPESGDYYMEFWGLPSKLSDGKYSEYSIFLDKEYVGKIVPRIGNWQSIEFDDKFYMSKGNHILSIGTRMPEIPMIETVKLSKNRKSASICSDEFDDYLFCSQRGETMDYLINTSSSQSMSAQNNNEDIGIDVPLLYTFYYNFYLKEGEEVIMTSESASDHILDVFFYGHPKYSNLYKSNAVDTNLVIRDSIAYPEPINPGPIPKKYNPLYKPASIDEIQGLNWKFISERSLNSTSEVISGYVRVPMTGYYLVRITSAQLLTPGTVNFNMNDKYYFDEVPINYFSVDHVFPALKSGCVAMTKCKNAYEDDPMLFVHGADADRVVAFNDDAKAYAISKFNLTAWDAFLSQSYKIVTNAVSLNSYSSLAPVSTCKLIIGNEFNLSQTKAFKKPDKHGLIQSKSSDNDISIEGDLRLNGQIYINSALCINCVSVYSIDGSVLCSLAPSESQLILPVMTMNISQPGLYVIKIETDEDVTIKKVVIN